MYTEFKGRLKRCLIHSVIRYYIYYITNQFRHLLHAKTIVIFVHIAQHEILIILFIRYHLYCNQFRQVHCYRLLISKKVYNLLCNQLIKHNLPPACNLISLRSIQIYTLAGLLIHSHFHPLRS